MIYQRRKLVKNISDKLAFPCVSVIKQEEVVITSIFEIFYALYLHYDPVEVCHINSYVCIV